MYIYNTTFIVAPTEKPTFMDWMRTTALPQLVNESLPARSPRLTLVTDVPADPDFASQAASFAFQVEFTRLEDARKWADIALMPVAGLFAGKFGNEKAAVFSTILQTVDL